MPYFLTSTPTYILLRRNRISHSLEVCLIDAWFWKIWSVVIGSSDFVNSYVKLQLILLAALPYPFMCVYMQNPLLLPLGEYF